MNTITETRRPHTPPPSETSSVKVTGLRVLRSEWTKLRTLRSSWITLALGVVALIGVTSIAATRYKANPADADFTDATVITLVGIAVFVAHPVFGVLGVLFSASEYSTGMIRATLAAVPKRLPVLWAKAAVYGVVTLVASTAAVFVGYLIANGVLAGATGEIAVSEPGVVRSLFGAGLFLALVAVICVAFGTLLRSVAAGISLFVGLFILVPGMLVLLPSSWRTDVDSYLPSNAGEALYSLPQTAGVLSPGKGLLVMLAWTALALAGAAYRLARKDA